ncbi:MAG: DUF4258 domain-containing protein [Acidithiobacillus sp.]
MTPYVITNHAREEMTIRGIAESTVDAVLRNPGQIVTVKNGLEAYQSVVFSDTGPNMLIRVIVTHGELPLRVVTVYQTSKITKYWRAS